MNCQEIIEWLDKYGVEHYTINDNLTIDVDGNVDLNFKSLSEIPFKFNIVNGVFNCSFNNLISLKNCPNVVNSSFYCMNNQLISLEYCPKIIKGLFWCDDSLKSCKEYQVYLMMRMLRK